MKRQGDVLEHIGSRLAHQNSCHWAPETNTMSLPSRDYLKAGTTLTLILQVNKTGFMGESLPQRIVVRESAFHTHTNLDF